MRKIIIKSIVLVIILVLVACNVQLEYQPEADNYALDEHAEVRTTGFVPAPPTTPSPTAELSTPQLETEPALPPETAELVPTSEPIRPVSLLESTHMGYSWVLPPIYDWISWFGDGFIRATVGGRTKIICTLTAEVIIPPIFQMVGDHEGLQHYMSAQLDNRWGVINAEGEVVLPFEYVHIRVYGDYGVAMVMSDDRSYAGIVELYTGRKIVPFGLYHTIFYQSGGIAQVSRRYGLPPNHRNVRGYINIVTGEEIIPLTYSGYGDGVSHISIGDTIAVSRDGLWGIIDHTGAYILPPTHDWIGWSVNGFAEFSTIDPISQNRYVGILNMKTGETIVPAIYQGSFFAGENIVLMRGGELGSHDNNVLINLETGQQFTFPYNIGDCIQHCGPIPPQFVNGISIVHVVDFDSYWSRIYGLADNQGREILPPTYDFMDWLPGGLLVVRKDEKWGIIDRNGQIVLPLIYCEIETALGGRNPNDNISAIRLGGEWVQIASNTSNPNWRLEGALWGFVDVNGQIAVPPILDFVTVHTIGYSVAAVQMSDGLWGLIRVYPQQSYTE